MNCEECQFYHWIDSGYGHCKRFPPLNKVEFKKKHFLFIPFYVPVGRIQYTLVAWCEKHCGEFKQRKKDGNCVAGEGDQNDTNRIPA